MVDANGESLLTMVERDENGNAIAMTGALWTDISGNNVVVYFDDDGMPEKTVMGNYILLFSNWSEDGTTVDVAKIYTPTNYIEVFKGVIVDANLVVPRKISTRTTCS